jgi:D-alanine-D-alanine ligase
VKIGITYTARSAPTPTPIRAVKSNGCPDDAEEEFDSPETVAAITAAIESLGHEVELLGDGPALAKRLLDGQRSDFVFNIAEGRGISRSREAWVPAMLESFGVAYSGSDPLTLAATLDKNCAKRLVRDAGVKVPAGIVICDVADLRCAKLDELSMPLIVKPAFEGSSKGIRSHSLVESRNELSDVITQCCNNYRQPALVEEFIAGEEITVGILGNGSRKELGVMRVVPLSTGDRFVYSLDVKRDWRRQVRYEVPAQLSEADQHAVRTAALAAHDALACRDVARLDFRLRDGVPYFLEANPLPGLTPGSSDLVIMFAGLGLEYRELIGRILNAALDRLAKAEGNACSDGRTPDAQPIMCL